VPRQWRLIWTTDPAHRATVSWNTLGEGSIHRVHYRSEDGREEGTVDCRETGRYTAGNEKIELYYHHVRLERLNAARQYRIAIESDGRRSAEFYFHTAPDDNRPVGLLLGGDSRSNQAVRRQMNQRMATLLRENASLLALAHGGDYVGSGSVLSEWSQWMSDHEVTTGPDGRLLPIIPARGNHDKGALFNEVFGFPPGDANYYATDLGEQLGLVTLNTETSIAGDQAKWLETQLKASRPAHRWLAVVYHRPAFPAVKAPSGALQFWVPIFDRYSVDLAYEADGHNIKRTVPIRDNVEDAAGVVYLGEGGLGAEQRKPKPNRWFLKSPGMGSSGHHVHLVIFSDEHWECRVVADNGKTLDEYFRKFRAPPQSAAK
jgi:hypothetical protein